LKTTFLSTEEIFRVRNKKIQNFHGKSSKYHGISLGSYTGSGISQYRFVS